LLLAPVLLLLGAPLSASCISRQHLFHLLIDAELLERARFSRLILLVTAAALRRSSSVNWCASRAPATAGRSRGESSPLTA
jgi:hypothetical protein